LVGDHDLEMAGWLLPFVQDGLRSQPAGRFPAVTRCQRTRTSSGTSYTFVTDGIKDAVEQARAVADGKDILLAGGVSIAQQALAAGLIDEVVLHLVPKLVGRGVRLFGELQTDLRCIESIPGEGALQLRYKAT
jgi:dihydrofolate reductase